MTLLDNILNKRWLITSVFRSIFDLKTEIKKTKISFAWLIIEPLIYLGIFYGLFHYLYGKSTQVSFFILIAVIAWKWFATSINASSRSIINSKNLINQIYIPKYVFPFSCVITSSIKFTISLFVFLIISFFLDTSIFFKLHYLIFLIFTQLMLTLSISLFIAMIGPFFPLVISVVENLLTIIFFLSGIFYNLNNLPKFIEYIIICNPMFWVFDSYKNILINNTNLDYVALFIIQIFSILITFLSLIFLKKFDKKYPFLV